MRIVHAGVYECEVIGQARFDLLGRGSTSDSRHHLLHEAPLRHLSIMTDASGSSDPAGPAAFDDDGVALRRFMALREEAQAQWRRGDAEASLRASRAALRALRGMEHGELMVPGILIGQGTLYRALGRYPQAERVLRRALRLAERMDDDLLRASVFSAQATLHAAAGRRAEAARLLRQVLAMRCRALGRRDLRTAMAANNLAVFLQENGEPERAGRLLRRVARIAEAAGESQLLLAARDNLAGVLRELGDLDGAERLYAEVLEARRRGLGNRHPDVGYSLNNLGELYRSLGRYSEAEACFREALELWRGGAAADVATVTSNLALVHDAVGERDVALRLHRQVLALRRRALGRDHADLATTLRYLGDLHRIAGELPRAERRLRTALRITAAASGEAHPDHAAVLSDLAALLGEEGRYAEAGALFRRALEIDRAALGEAHPRVAVDLANVGEAARAIGRLDEAEAAFREALARMRGDPPNAALARARLAWVAGARGDRDEAFALLRDAMEREDRLLHDVFAAAPEERRLAFLGTLRLTLFHLLSLALAPGAPDEVRGAALDAVLRRKGLGADAAAAQREVVLGSGDPSLAAAHRAYLGLRRRLAARTLDGPGVEGERAHRRRLRAWTARLRTMEGELARRVPAMRLEERLRRAGREEVAALLPAGSALVEIVRWEPIPLAPPAAGEEAERGPARYLALVVHAGRPDAVRLVDLGDADEADRAVARYRAAVEGRHAAPPVRAGEEPGAGPVEAGARGGPRAVRAALEATRHVRPPPAAEAGEGDAGEALRRAVFDPLLPALEGCGRLLLSPDGDLARLPFEALPLEGAHLLDRYRVSYLATGRDLLRLAQPPVRAGRPVVAADPDYELGRAPGAGPPLLARLEETRAEGIEVAARLGVRPLLGAEARKGRIRGRRSPRVLHLATHGFFFPDPVEDGGAGERAGRLSRAANPLVRSGVALAGAGTWLAGGTPPRGAGDGLLTAEEVAAMDLRGTRLVVLSACDTGMGEVRVGEGVFGLRRAFALAGARTLVMSLWKVPDAETRLLMGRFYDALDGGSSPAEALHAARLAVRAVRPEPYYWGAFVCQGDPGTGG